MIEKVRTVITDNRGQYKVLELSPGVYRVSFTLPGFATVRREGIELAGNFTATVNAEMRVGAVEESLTVSAQAPVVDSQNVVQSRVATSAVIAALPTARTPQGLAAAIPGITMLPVIASSAQDVGGSASMNAHRLIIHGGDPLDAQNTLDGIANNNSNGVANAGLWVDTGSVQEYNFQLGVAPADAMIGGEEQS